MSKRLLSSLAMKDPDIDLLCRRLLRTKTMLMIAMLVSNMVTKLMRNDS